MAEFYFKPRIKRPSNPMDAPERKPYSEPKKQYREIAERAKLKEEPNVEVERGN